MRSLSVSIVLPRSLHESVQDLNLSFVSITLDTDSRISAVFSFESQKSGWLSCSVALSTMMAWGRMGWLADVSLAFVAQLISFSKPCSITLPSKVDCRELSERLCRKGKTISRRGIDSPMFFLFFVVVFRFRVFVSGFFLCV